MPVAVMAESSVSFRRLLEQCETQELEVPRAGGRSACGVGGAEVPWACVCVCVCESGVGSVVELRPESPSQTRSLQISLDFLIIFIRVVPEGV